VVTDQLIAPPAIALAKAGFFILKLLRYSFNCLSCNGFAQQNLHRNVKG
jgi:hypothetical protein